MTRSSKASSHSAPPSTATSRPGATLRLSLAASASASASASTSDGDLDLYDKDADSGAIRRELMPSWSSEAFAGVVEGMGALVDDVCEAERRRLGGDSGE